MRKLAYELRAMAGRDFEIRPYTVSVVTKVWSGSQPGEGSATTTTTAITEDDGQPPKVRVLNDEQIALGGLPRGAVKVGPITPDFPGGGTAFDTLSPASLDAGDSFYYVLTGPDYPSGARFVLKEAQADRTFGYFVTLVPMSAD